MNGMVMPLTYGRMGNFLFQAATAMAYAWKHGMEYTLPSTTKDPFNNPIYLQHLVNKNYCLNLRSVRVEERGHGYQEIAFQEHWKRMNIILDGYWQSEKYFIEYRDRVLEEFNYPWDHKQEWVSVHVRRGDYLILSKKHPVVTKQWYEQAMESFPDYRFRFFSDDIGWCMRAFGDRGDCTFSQDKTPEQDLIDMSCCAHHICSASTFSWWGAWLNRSVAKRIVMPQHWFVPGYKSIYTEDIVPPDWERL